VPELAKTAFAPARDAPVHAQRTRVLIAQRDLPRVGNHRPNDDGGIVRREITELRGSVRTPAIDLALGSDDAGVGGTYRDVTK
jgi:hypothetical protein